MSQEKTASEPTWPLAYLLDQLGSDDEQERLTALQKLQNMGPEDAEPLFTLWRQDRRAARSRRPWSVAIGVASFAIVVICVFFGVAAWTCSDLFEFIAQMLPLLVVVFLCV